MLAAIRRRLLLPPLPLPLPLPLLAAFSTSTASDATVSYLISSCGLSPTAAARAARSVSLATSASTAQADAVLDLLRRYGFSNADISTTVRQFPVLLASNPAKTLQPKLDFLAAKGFSEPVLARLVSMSPIVLHRSVQDHLVPLFDSVRAILGSDACVATAFRRMPFVLRCDHKATLLRGLPELQRVHGLSRRDVARIVRLNPGVIMLSPDRIHEVVANVKNAGVNPGDPMFVYVFVILCKMKTPTLERKLALYQSLGFEKDDIIRMLRRYPSSMATSEEKIRVIFGFLIGKVGLKLEDIVTYPHMLVRCLESLARRCAVLSLLRRVGKVDVGSVPRALLTPKKRFLEVYVRRYKHHIPDVVRAFNGEISFEGFDGLEEKSQGLVQGPSGKMSV